MICGNLTRTLAYVQIGKKGKYVGEVRRLGREQTKPWNNKWQFIPLYHQNQFVKYPQAEYRSGAEFRITKPLPQLLLRWQMDEFICDMQNE